MLEFVERLTLAPWDVGVAERAALERAGWHPLEIVQIVLGCAHFNYLNRMADGLGITFEYATGIERFEKGGGEARRAELVGHAPRAATSDRASRASASRDHALGESIAPELTALLAFHRDLERGVLAWRAFHLRGTEILNAEARAQLALYAAAVEWCDSAKLDAERAAEAAGVSPSARAALREGKIPEDATPLMRRSLDHVRKLLTAPASVIEDDLVALRDLGFDDREIVRLTMATAYLSFEHRARFGLRGFQDRETTS